MLDYLATLSLWNHPWAATQWGVVIGASLVAALVDARTFRIPNKLTFPLFGSGLVWAH